MVDSEKRERNITTLITAKTLAKMLSTSVRSIWRYRSSGRLPETVKIAGAIRWRRSDIEKWIEWGCCSASEFRARKEVADNG